MDPLRLEDRETRATYRAFYTAPPVIPHEGASGMLKAACLTCHDQAGMYESLITPHPERVSCRQCHVPLPGMEFTR